MCVAGGLRGKGTRKSRCPCPGANSFPQECGNSEDPFCSDQASIPIVISTDLRSDEGSIAACEP